METPRSAAAERASCRCSWAARSPPSSIRSAFAPCSIAWRRWRRPSVCTPGRATKSAPRRSAMRRESTAAPRIGAAPSCSSVASVRRASSAPLAARRPLTRDTFALATLMSAATQTADEEGPRPPADPPERWVPVPCGGRGKLSRSRLRERQEEC